MGGDCGTMDPRRGEEPRGFVLWWRGTCRRTASGRLTGRYPDRGLQKSLCRDDPVDLHPSPIVCFKARNRRSCDHPRLPISSSAAEETSASAEEMSAQVEEITASTYELGAMASRLSEQIARFRLADGEPGRERHAA